MELWPHQEEGLLKLRRSIASGKRRPVVQAPTGAGKTRLAAAIVEGARNKGNRVIFTVPALELIDQTITAFWDQGIKEVGVLQAQHIMTDTSQPVQIASVQTLARRVKPVTEVVIIDECHRVFESVTKWLATPEMANIPVIGLSATPWTKGLGKIYDDLIIVATTEGLIEKKLLSGFKVYAVSHPDLAGVRTLAGDYHEGDLSAAMDKPDLTADAVDAWQRLGDNRPTLVFAVDRAHAKRLQQDFEKAGVSTGYIDCFTPDDERKEVRKAFHEGSIKVVCNVNCLTMGVDWDVRCIVLARPTKSEMLFVQMIGRGLRTADGKDCCKILDCSDTHLRLGFVTDIHHSKLHDGKPVVADKKTPPLKLPKECPKCKFLKPAKVHVCPACGFAPERQSAVVAGDGELEELRRLPATMFEKQEWYSMLLTIGRRRGYKLGWAANQYRQKFGVWPNGLSKHEREPTFEVWGYVKSRQIAWAKSKHNKHERHVTS